MKFERKNIIVTLRENMKKIGASKTANQAIVFSIFSFLNSGVNFFLLIIIAGFVSPSGYGNLNLFNISVTLFGFLICLNTTGIIPVNYFRKEKTEVCRSINTVFVLSIICFLFLTGVVFIYGDDIENVIGISLPYQWIALWVCFFQVFTTVNLDIWRLEEKPVAYGIYSLGLVLMNFVLTIIFIIAYHTDWLGRVYAQVLSGAVFFIISIIFLLKRGYLRLLKPMSQNLKEAIFFGIPLIPHSISFWLRQGLDRFFINNYHNVSVVGLFSLSLNFSNIIQIIGTAFNAANSVYIYKSLAENTEGTRKKLQRQTKLMIIFFIFVTIAICLGASVFIPLFFPKYKDSISFLFFQCLGAMFQCIYLLFVNYLFYYKKTQNLMYITFSISVLHAIMSYWLTRYSVLYTVVIGAITNFLTMIGVLLYSRKIYKII